MEPSIHSIHRSASTILQSDKTYDDPFGTWPIICIPTEKRAFSILRWLTFSIYRLINKIAFALSSNSWILKVVYVELGWSQLPNHVRGSERNTHAKKIDS